MSISTAVSSSPNDSSSFSSSSTINAAKTQVASILIQPLDADSLVTYLQESIQLRAMPLARSIADELQCIVSEATDTLLLLSSSSSVSSSKQQQQLLSSSCFPLVQHSHLDMKRRGNDIDMSDNNNSSSSSVTAEIIMLREIITRAFLYYSQLRSICSSISSLLSCYHGIHSIINQQLSITLDNKAPGMNPTIAKLVIPEFNYKFINKMIINDADEVIDYI